jgi:hypothetical protein
MNVDPCFFGSMCGSGMPVPDVWMSGLGVSMCDDDVLECSIVDLCLLTTTAIVRESSEVRVLSRVLR